MYNLRHIWWITIVCALHAHAVSLIKRDVHGNNLKGEATPGQAYFDTQAWFEIYHKDCSIFRPLLAYWTPRYLQLWSDAKNNDMREFKKKLSRNNVNTYDRADGTTLLHLAMHKKHPEMARSLIACGADVNARAVGVLRGTAMTPLQLVQSFEDEQAIRIAHMLITHNANPHVKNSLGQTPVHFASAKSPRVTFAFLVNGASVDVRDQCDASPLIDAVFWPAVHSAHGPQNVGKQSISILLNRGAQANVWCREVHNSVQGVTHLLRSALHLAAKHAGAEEVLELLKYGAQVDAYGYDQTYTGTPERWACQADSRIGASILRHVEHAQYGRADLCNTPYVQRGSVGQIALGQEWYDKALTIAHHSDTTDIERGHMLFHAKRLIACGGHDTHRLCNFISELERVHGVRRMQYYMIQALGEQIQKEAVSYETLKYFNIDALVRYKDARGNTFLHYLARAPHLTTWVSDIACRIMANGQHDAYNSDGETPLMIARRCGNTQFVSMFYILRGLTISSCPDKAQSRYAGSSGRIVLTPVTQKLPYDQLWNIISYLPYYDVLSYGDADIPSV